MESVLTKSNILLIGVQEKDVEEETLEKQLLRI